MEMEWFTHKPPTYGYYLVAWRLRRNQVVVSELWYNPKTKFPWWFTRAYTMQPKRGGNLDAMTNEVIAWMPLPDPPKDPFI